MKIKKCYVCKKNFKKIDKMRKVMPNGKIVKLLVCDECVKNPELIFQALTWDQEINNIQLVEGGDNG